MPIASASVGNIGHEIGSMGRCTDRRAIDRRRRAG
jgi:hypothetical protein